MSGIRTRWAAIGAAVAVTLGAGGLGVVNAVQSSGERGVYTAIEPCRLVDTRPGQGIGGRTSPLGPEENYQLQGTGNNGECTGIPNDAIALALNVTPVAPTRPTNLRFFPGGPVPNASSLNPAPGQPPTPNAVTVDLANDGSFRVYNFQGQVHLVADIVGYYRDHNHDDRYFTKGQTNNRIQSAIDTQPWSIHVAPSDLETNRWDSGGGTAADFWPAVAFGNGVSAAGMAFNDGMFSRVWYGLQLPANYAPGTDIQVDMRWIPVSGFGAPVFPCDSVWWSNVPRVSRAESAGFTAGVTWEIARGFDQTQTRLTATQDQFDNSIIGETYMTIEGTDLQPGDMLTITLNRDGDESDDTCEGMMITGLTAHPAG